MVEEYGPIMAGAASLLGGIWLLIHALGQIKLAKMAAISWLKAHGNVIKSSKRISNFGSSKSRNKKENTYLLDFEFEYFVDGHKYKSTKPLFFGLYVFDDIESFLSRYPEGKAISVYYDPIRHQRAVIETTLHGKSGKHEIAFGVMLILLAIVLFAIRYEVLYQWVNRFL